MNASIKPDLDFLEWQAKLDELRVHEVLHAMNARNLLMELLAPGHDKETFKAAMAEAMESAKLGALVSDLRKDEPGNE